MGAELTRTSISVNPVHASPRVTITFLLAGLLVVLLLGLLANLPADPALRDTVLYSIRLPRAVFATLGGAVLALSGAALQALLRNPLAEPALLGVSAGAAFAAVSVLSLVSLLGVAAGLVFWLPVCAFAGGVAVVLLVMRLATREGRLNVSDLLLAGMAVNLLAGTGVGLLTYLAPDAQLRGVTFWALGSLSGLGWREVLPAGCWMLLSMAVLLPLRDRLNLLSMGESEALYMGLPVQRMKYLLILGCTLGVGASVAVAGIIGFIGLVVPHLLRLVVGPDYRHLLPASAVGGALLLCLADLLARSWLYPAELPVGLLTTLLGGPLFLWLLVRGEARRS